MKCMTSKEFLESGYEYREGDIVRNMHSHLSVTIPANRVADYNYPGPSDADWVVLYAAALDNRPEKPSTERLDAYVQAALTGLCSNASLFGSSFFAGGERTADKLGKYAAIVGEAVMKEVDRCS